MNIWTGKSIKLHKNCVPIVFTSLNMLIMLNFYLICNIIQSISKSIFQEFVSYRQSEIFELEINETPFKSVNIQKCLQNIH